MFAGAVLLLLALGALPYLGSAMASDEPAEPTHAASSLDRRTTPSRRAWSSS